jgi:hypothetical protein
MENLNITVKRSWTKIAELPSNDYSVLSNNSQSAMEWIIVNSGTPTTRSGHLLEGGAVERNLQEGHLYAKVSEMNQVVPLTLNAVLSYEAVILAKTYYQFVVTGGVAEANLTATGLTATSHIVSAVMYDAGVPSVITGNIESQTTNIIVFDVDTTGNVILLTWYA